MNRKHSDHLMMVIMGMMVLIIASFCIIKINAVVHGSGVIVTKDNTQIVSLSKGGIIDHVYVAEGDYVEKGQVLADTSNLDMQKEYAKARAQKAFIDQSIEELNRVLAWKSDFKDLDLTPLTNKELIGNLELLKSQIYTKELKAQGLSSDIERLGISRVSKNAELSLLKEEVNLLSPLVKKGISSYTNLLAKKQATVRLNADIIELDNQIAAKKDEIRILNNEGKDAEFELRNTLSKKLMDAQHEKLLNDSEENILARQMKDAKVKSPVNGVIYKINKSASTEGGVIQAVDSLFEIKPLSEKIQAEVKVQPKDRDQVYVGGDVNIKILSFILSSQKPYQGKIVQISPDSYEESVNGSLVRYYKAIVEFNISPAAQKMIKPGMVIDAYVITGKHSIMKYLISPLIKGMDQVFSEPIQADANQHVNNKGLSHE